MWKRRERKPLTVDIDHMKVLHQEAIEQLDLMRTALEAAVSASGTMRDALDAMAENHWHAYLDGVHMITMHDEALAGIMKKPSVDNETSEYAERRFTAERNLLLLLMTALSRRHQRFSYLWGVRSTPMSAYYQESMTMEREHIAELIALIETMM